MEISDDQFRELLNRYLNGVATPDERQVLDKFFQSYETEVTRQDLTAEQADLRDGILNKIHMQVGVKRKGGHGRLMSLWLPIAATILIFALAFIFTGVEDRKPLPEIHHAMIIQDSTGPGERVVRILPDGTKVHLNSRTKVIYPEAFETVREISLIGEGYFEVVPNEKPFIVRSGNVKTQVLGTSFNVKHREGSNTEITLSEGKVDVFSTNGDSFNLSPGEQAVVDVPSGNMTKRNVNVLRYAGWKDNILFFEQTTFEDAVHDIEEWYGVQIEIANPLIRKCVITAKYQGEPLGNVLSSLQFLFSLDIKRLEGSHFLIDGHGCQ